MKELLSTLFILLLSILPVNSRNSNLITPNYKIVVIKNFCFEFGTAIILPEGRTDIKRASEAMNAYKEIKIELTPHLDSIEFLRFGKKLAMQRLDTVITLLNKEGVINDRIVRGNFQNKFVTTNESEEKRSLNRCVSIMVVE